jgi:hypothetical protein
MVDIFNVIQVSRFFRKSCFAALAASAMSGGVSVIASSISQLLSTPSKFIFLLFRQITNHVLIKHKQMSYVLNGGKFKLYAVSKPTQLRF